MKESNPSASIIVCVYNQVKTLEWLLTSLKGQTCLDFEVVIADDGSDLKWQEPMKQLLCRDYPFSIQFCTQEKRGYRKAMILNSAIRQARSDYLIFLDADVFVEDHFVEDHLFLRRPGKFVCGRRIDLSQSLSESLSLEMITLKQWGRLNRAVFRDGWMGWKRTWRIKNSLVRRWMGYERPIDLLGSNFSSWKKDLQAVNGFNEEMMAYWGEDGDLYARLCHDGKQAINAKGLCIQYHVFHPRREVNPMNRVFYERSLQEQHYRWAQQGLVKSDGHLEKKV